MTLIVGGINKDNAFLSADRRISSNGQLIDDETTKTFFITTPDSRGVFAFTGLAYCNNFKTESWLSQCLNEISKEDQNIESILRKIKAQLDIHFVPSKIHCQNVFLTILYIGYIYNSTGHEPRIFRISNFEYGGKPNAFVFTEHDTEDIQVAGQANSVTDEQKDKLKKLLLENRQEALKVVSYLTIKKASTNSLSNNSVGQRANVCSFSSEINTTMTSIYYTNSLSNKCYGANCFLYNEGGFMSMLGSVLTVSPFAPSTVIPKVGRNELCPCHSGLKYKNCHESIRYPYLPIATRIRLTENGYPSGNEFHVENIGAY
jgi:hypothetical protein